MTTSSSHRTCILFADYSISSIDFAVGTPCQRIELKWRWMTYPHPFPSLLVRTLLWEFHGYRIFFPFFALDIEWAGFHRACNFWNCCYCYRIDSYHHGLLLPYSLMTWMDSMRHRLHRITALNFSELGLRDWSYMATVFVGCYSTRTYSISLRSVALPCCVTLHWFTNRF